MDGETPSWLDEGADSSAPASSDPSPATSADPVPPPSFSIDETTPPVPVPDQSAGGGGAPRAAAPTDNVAGSILAGMNANTSNADAAAAAKAEADETDLPKMILFMRVLNMAAATLLVTCSILVLVKIPHISVWVMAIYATCGGLLICCLETQLKFVRTAIAMNFGFLFNPVYRFLFYCLMASVSWSYKGILGYVTGILLGCVAVFNTYILVKFPAYRKMREQIAAEEDKRIQGKINQQVRKQAISNMGWGKN